MDCTYKFTKKDFRFHLDWKNWEMSRFDLYLQKAWEERRKWFRYKVNIEDSKFLEGSYKFFAQLNTNRAGNRRAPDEFSSVNQPFSYEGFNFSKMNKEEIMFSLLEDGQNENEREKNYFAINVSPLEKYHCLLLPSLFSNLNQVVTKESLNFALNTMLISSCPEMRLGFNSLCGFASLNHLHLHVYYLSVPMLLEYIEVRHLAGRCYVLESYPGKGFVFQITAPEEIEVILHDIHTLVSYFIKKNIAHNIYFTRGVSFQKSGIAEETTVRNCIRIYLWARTSSTGAKLLDAFNPAMCELFGHVLVKTLDSYRILNEEFVEKILEEITCEIFYSIKDEVKSLF